MVEGNVRRRTRAKVRRRHLHFVHTRTRTSHATVPISLTSPTPAHERHATHTGHADGDKDAHAVCGEPPYPRATPCARQLRQAHRRTPLATSTPVHPSTPVTMSSRACSMHADRKENHSTHTDCNGRGLPTPLTTCLSPYPAFTAAITTTIYILLYILCIETDSYNELIINSM